MNLTFRGITKTAAEWGREVGLHAGTIQRRKCKGLTDEEAITLPTHAHWQHFWSALRAARANVPAANDRERFEDKVYRCPMSGCWLWTGALGHRGYAHFKIDGGVRPGHRIAWELYVGPIPDGLLVLHRCDVPGCVNPAHLFLGTHADNSADMMAKGRWRGTGPRKTTCS